jgi:ABC-type sugar transport system ATPase subunit
MVFQSYALYPHMTVYDNMAFALKIAGDDKERSTGRCARRRKSCS